MRAFLQFPNARLLIHNLLADEHLSGAEAIARGALEYGVLPQEGLYDVELTCAIQNCDCCAAAHCVLRNYFKAANSQSDGEAVENAWKSLLSRLNKYRTGTAKAESDQVDAPDCQNSCSSLAPVLFDLLLQEVRRNS